MKPFKLGPKFYIIFCLIFSVPFAYVVTVFNAYLLTLSPNNFLNYLASSGIIEVPTTVALLLTLFWVTDNFLWRIKFIQKILDIPDINGRYEGELVSSYDETKTYPIVLEIKQSLNKISINLFTERSSSYSLTANIGKNNKGSWSVFYIYQNNTSAMNEDEDMKDHNGVALLEIFDLGSNLKGNYFNNPRDRGRYGTINVKRIDSKKMNKYA